MDTPIPGKKVAVGFLPKNMDSVFWKNMIKTITTINTTKMKAKKGFNLRNVCGQNIIVAEGEENIDFSNIISMNESSAFLWKKVQPMNAFSIDDMVRLLTDEYEIDDNTAHNDCMALAKQWADAGIVDM